MPMPEPGAYEAETRTAFDHGYRKAAARLADKSLAVKVDFDQL